MTASALGFQPRIFNKEEASAKFPPFLSCLDKVLKNRLQTDTKVTIGKRTFECHMIVLKCYSDYFVNWSKNKHADMQDIILPEDQVTAIAFEKIYEWMLSDVGNVTRTDFARVFKAAKFLKINELVDQMMCIIDDKKVIGEREALSLYLEAKSANEKTIKSFMMRKISKIFLTFSASYEFLDLASEDIEQLLQSNCLGVNSELDVLFTAIRWLQHEWPLRKAQVPKLLRYVRFELIQPWQLVELKQFPPELEHIFKNEEVQAIIDEALTFISLQYTDKSSGDADQPPTILNRCLIFDPTWNQFDFETNPNFSENYENFCKYLKLHDATHWRKLKYADPKHESVIM